MEPQVWGPHGWFFLHSITMAYPEQPTSLEKKNYLQFFRALPNVLPCEVCRKNLKNHIANLPIEPALYNRQTLVEWLINIHNMANIELGKPIMSYEQVIQKYKQLYSGQDHIPFLKDTKLPTINSDNSNYKIYFLIFIIILLSLWIIKTNVSYV